MKIRLIGMLVTAVLTALLALPSLAQVAQAQEANPLGADATQADEGQAEPGTGLSQLRFLNPRARIALPEPMPGPVLRFVVADDFPLLPSLMARAAWPGCISI